MSIKTRIRSWFNGRLTLLLHFNSRSSLIYQLFQLFPSGEARPEHVPLNELACGISPDATLPFFIQAWVDGHRLLGFDRAAFYMPTKDEPKHNAQ